LYVLCQPTLWRKLLFLMCKNQKKHQVSSSKKGLFL